MKTKIIVILLSIMAISVIARIIPPFRDWNYLENESPSIVVVVAGNPVNPTPANFHGSPTKSDYTVTVLSSLKGTNNVRSARLQTDHDLNANEGYLVFSRGCNDGIYNAWEDYRVVPIGWKFSQKMIEGKPLDDQLQILFQLAISNLDSEIADKQAEKERIESGLKN